MVDFFDKVAGRKIVKTGVVLAKQDQTIEIYPINTDKSMLRFVVEISDDVDESVTLYDPNEDDVAFIKVTRPWLSAESSANIGNIEIGYTKTDRFYLSYSLDLYGTPDKFDFKFHYQIATESLK